MHSLKVCTPFDVVVDNFREILRLPLSVKQVALLKFRLKMHW
jgi:hypothetical protein